MPVSYGEFEPANELRPLLSSYWIFRAEAPLPPGFAHSVPPDGAVSLVARRGAPPVALGPRTEPLRPPVFAGAVVYGARLWPGAARAVLRSDVSRLRNQVVPLAEVVPAEWAEAFALALADTPSDEQAVARLDRLWAPLAPRQADLDPAVLRAVFAILQSQGSLAIARLAGECGLSERHLRRRFVQAVGLSPKELARVRRLRSSLVEALSSPQRRWVELACASGYCDQAHLVREYKRLSGLAPEAFLAQLDCIRHRQLRA